MSVGAHMDDTSIRFAAFQRVGALSQVFGDDIPWSAISAGISLADENILLANKAVGIFRPRQMKRGVLSIKTTRPRSGRVNIYSDREDADGDFVYSLQGDDPNNHYNRALREALEDNSPFIYLHAVSAGIYKAIYPCFIVAIDISTMTCRVTVGTLSTAEYPKSPEHLFEFPTQIERRYAVREAKVRLHQAAFRELVLAAYGSRCAMSTLPVPELLEAAHIIPDSHSEGIAEVRNGICLSRIHHRAFDSNLIAVNPDYRIVVSERLMQMSDGPLLESGLKEINGKKICLPKDSSAWPDRALLDRRFNEFSSWKWPT